MVIATIVVLLLAVLALLGLRRLPGHTPRRSGRPGKHGHRFGMR
jgi:hypothetical protein